jgi:hypothetical protein
MTSSLKLRWLKVKIKAIYLKFNYFFFNDHSLGRTYYPQCTAVVENIQNIYELKHLQPEWLLLANLKQALYCAVVKPCGMQLIYVLSTWQLSVVGGITHRNMFKTRIKNLYRKWSLQTRFINMHAGTTFWEIAHTFLSIT